MFPGATRLWVVIMLCIFGAISCQEGCRCRGCTGCSGCTTSVVVDHEDKKMKVDGVKIKLRANKNKVTHRKLRLDQEIYVDKDSWYSVDYYLRIEKRDAIKNICEYDVPKNQNLTESIKKFTINFSPDKNHFAVGLDNKVFNFFHLLSEGVPFSSGCYYLKDPNYTYLLSANIDFDNINWSRFPNPELLFDEIIIPNEYAVWTYVHNRTNILSFLDKMPPGNRHELVLIENWYSELAYSHFNERKVMQIIGVSPLWKKTAEKSLIKCIDEKTVNIDSELKSTLDMVLWINDKATLNTIDSIVFDDYFAEGHVGGYFTERFSNSNKPIKEQIKKALLSKAKEICSKTNISSFDYSKKMSVSNAVEFLLISREHKTLEQFIENNVTLSEIEENFSEIPDATIDKYEKYPPSLQKLMVEKYTAIMKAPESDIFGMTISDIVDFLKNKITCDDLKEIVNLHQNDLFGFKMPKRCK